MPELLSYIEELSAHWLTAVLFPDASDTVADFHVDRIGNGLAGTTYRVRYVTAAGRSETVVVKLSALTAEERAGVARLGLYNREVRFYLDVAPTCRMRIPACHFAAIDNDGEFSTVVLDDIGDAIAGDQLAGIPVDRARAAITNLARLHAEWWGNEWVTAQPWLAQRNRQWVVDRQRFFAAGLGAFDERIGPTLAAEQRNIVHHAVGGLADYAEGNWDRPVTLTHFDYRPDNLLYTGDGDVVALDFQTVSCSPGCADVAYLLQGGMAIEDRRRHELDLVRLYHNTLVDEGIADYAWDVCWAEYQRQTSAGLMMAVLGVAVAQRTERGDQMIEQWFDRLTTAGLDLGGR